MLGGDIIDDPSESNLRFLGRQMERLSVPYVYTLGNHDWTFPWEYMTEYGKTEYRPKFSGWMDGSPALHILDLGELFIVSVDNSSGQVNPDALEAYRSVLEENKPVILVIHVPLMAQSLLEKTVEVWNSPVVLGDGENTTIYPNETSKEFMALTLAENSPVELILSGHVHLYDRDVVLGENRQIPQIVGPAGYEGYGISLTVTGNDR